MEIVLAALGVLAVVIVGVVMWKQPHPEDSASHQTPDERQAGGPTQEPYPSGSNPAGPGAESQDPDESSPQPPPA